MRTLPLSFRPKRGAGRRAKRRNLSHCTFAFALNIGPRVPIELFHLPGRFLDCARLHPCSARNDILRRGCRPHFTRLAQSGVCRRGVAAALFRERRVAAAVFREQALLHFTTLFRGQQCFAPHCHSEPPRMRRVEESNNAAEKQLQCNHTRVPIFTPYRTPAGSFDFEPRYSLGSPLRMTERTACRIAFIRITGSAFPQNGYNKYRYIVNSSHEGLASCIRLSFFLRVQPFNCFSRAIASFILL